MKEDMREPGDHLDGRARNARACDGVRWWRRAHSVKRSWEYIQVHEREGACVKPDGS